MNLKNIFKVFKSYFLITVGLLFYTLAWTVFIIPNSMVGGGVTGISAVIHYCTGFPVSYSFFIINALLLVVAIKVLGRGFGMKTVYAIFATTILLRVTPELIPADLIEEIAVNNGRLLSAIIGGLLSGFGVAITFAQGGSSGGTDIVALIVNKYRAVAPGRIILALDIIIIASSLIVPSDGTWGGRIATVIYGYIVSGVFSTTVDMIGSGNKQSVQIFIFSKKYAEIADGISNTLHRGATLLTGMGWHTKQDVNILMVVTRKNDTNFVLSLIKSIDPTAFISVGSIMGVYGQGFEQIKK